MINRILGILVCIMPTLLAAQISEGGIPLAKKHLMPSSLPWVELASPDIDALMAEDFLNRDRKDIPWRFGYNHQTDIDLFQTGVSHTMPDGRKVWRLGIRTAGALSVNLVFDQFYIPQGGKLFIYHPNFSEVLGAFTSANNNSDRVLGTTIVHGDKVVIEYLEPLGSADNATLHLSQVTHGYRSLFLFAKDLGTSGSCNNNVICPEGDDWRDQIRSVAIIIVNGNGACTGALINNACEDGTPYFLTANHCLGGNTSSWVFRFNWDSPDCLQNLNGPTNQTISGATTIAKSPDSDFALLQLSSVPPASYNVYYAGWDRSGNIPQTQTGIHHPDGDVKKITFNLDSADKAAWQSAETWHIPAWDDGTTEPGSSGSPLFDQNKRIIGQLYGGDANCSNNVNDYYGRLDMSWYGQGTPDTRLLDWLGGCDTLLAVLDGYDPNAPQYQVDIKANKILGAQGTLCASGISPALVFQNKGVDTLTTAKITLYIDGAAKDSINWIGLLYSNQQDTVNFGPYSLPDGQHDLEFVVKDPNNTLDLNLLNDSVSGQFTLYSDGEVYTVKIASDFYGSDITWTISDSTNTLASGGPYANSNTDTLHVRQVCLPKGCFTFTIYDASGDGIASGSGGDGSYTVFSSDGDTLVYGAGNSYTTSADTLVCKESVGIQNFNNSSALRVYPNPTTDKLFIEHSALVGLTEIEIYQLTGAMVERRSLQGMTRVELDVSGFGAGTYILNLRNQGSEYRKLFTIRAE